MGINENRREGYQLDDGKQMAADTDWRGARSFDMIIGEVNCPTKEFFTGDKRYAGLVNFCFNVAYFVALAISRWLITLQMSLSAL